MKYIFGIILITALFIGCKKGEEDPFLSLRSRKARVVGDWVASSSTEQKTTTISYPEEASSDNELRSINETRDITMDSDLINVLINATKTFDDASEETEKIETSGGNTYTRIASELPQTENGSFEPTVSYSVSFLKNNTFTVIKTMSFVFSTTDDTNPRYDRTFKIELKNDETYSGAWEFLSKEGEFKNKERIKLNVTSLDSEQKRIESIVYSDKDPDDDVNWSDFNTTETSTWTSTTLSEAASEEVWELVMLKNKEIKANIVSELSYEASYNDNQLQEPLNVSFTTSKNVNIELKQ